MAFRIPNEIAVDLVLASLVVRLSTAKQICSSVKEAFKGFLTTLKLKTYCYKIISRFLDDNHLKHDSDL